MKKQTVVIDCFPESADRYRTRYAIVVIDVIRASTTATTALALGRRVLPARTSDEASVKAATLQNPLLAGELGGNKPFGFDITNSPAQIARRTDVDRPMVFVSSSGTQLLVNAAGAEAVYVACLRNATAVARHLIARHPRVAVLGAGTRGQFRREDQFGCALVARQLIDAGYSAETPATIEIVERWRSTPVDVIRGGRSAEYLRRSGQEDDLEFVLGHLDDLETVPSLVDGELIDAARQVDSPAVHVGRQAHAGSAE